MYNVLKKLIGKHFYQTKEEALEKVNVFYACNQLTDEEYAELMALIEETYND